jgi:hypothetical protein
VFVGFPLALFGAINHLIPAVLVRRIARATSRDADHWATNVIYPGAIIFPAYYVLVLAMAWLMLPAFWAAIYSLALPYTGYYLLLMWDRSHAVFRRIRTFCRFLFRPELQSRLHREQQAIITDIRNVEEEMLASNREPTDSRT